LNIEIPVPVTCFGPTDTIPVKQVKPPFHGTIFIWNNLITENDPTCFTKLGYTGVFERTMFDRRVAGWIKEKPHCF
jgi:hypothetical protein